MTKRGQAAPYNLYDVINRAKAAGKSRNTNKI